MDISFKDGDAMEKGEYQGAVGDGMAMQSLTETGDSTTLPATGTEKSMESSTGKNFPAE